MNQLSTVVIINGDLTVTNSNVAVNISKDLFPGDTVISATTIQKKKVAVRNCHDNKLKGCKGLDVAIAFEETLLLICPLTILVDKEVTFTGNT